MEGRGRSAGFRFPEWMVFLGALGILVSVAVPTYLQVTDRGRVEAFTASAVRLWEDVQSRTQTLAVAEARDPAALERSGPPVVSRTVPPEAVSGFLGLYDSPDPQAGPAEALIVVQPAGLPADRCARDGKIHVIPAEAGQDGVVSAVTVLVTDVEARGGPAGNGLLAVYEIRSDR